MLVDGEWRHVDEVAPFPREFLRLVCPLPFEGVEAVELEVPVQVVAGALDAEQHFLPHVAVLAGALAGIEELHIGLDAALPRVHLVVHQMLDEPVRRALPGHLVGADDVGQRLVHLTELLRRGDILDAQARGLAAHMGEIAFVENPAHLLFPVADQSPRGSIAFAKDGLPEWQSNSRFALSTRRIASLSRSSSKTRCTLARSCRAFWWRSSKQDGQPHPAAHTASARCSGNASLHPCAEAHVSSPRRCCSSNR